MAQATPNHKPGSKLSEEQKRTRALSVLAAARDRIAVGWTQHRLFELIDIDAGIDGGVRYCALGAIIDATDCVAIAGPLRPAVRDTKKLLKAVIGDVDIAEWNDHPLRTRNQVLAAFNRAIYAGSAT